MPTVPPTCVPVDPLVSVPLSNPDLLASDENIAGPTPDPDTDEIVLVPADVGNAVSHDSFESSPPQPILKPRLDLGTIVLHSPSSIVGTPFDPSPRFEYPFPTSGCSPHLHQHLDPAMSFSTILSSPLFGGAIPPKAKSDVRSFSPTHPKFHPRDPPVPPGLVKRRLRRDSMVDSPAASAPEAPQGQPRDDSLNSLSKLERLNSDARARDRSADARQANQRSWSPARNTKWKRNSLALGEQPSRRSGTPDASSKLFLSQNNSSPALAHEVFGYKGLGRASPTPRPPVPMAL
ncbi:hypothetical protein L226DRAFT_523080 [Lentinus tigrinus ALCF2SS1-7]|uniref:Uncharacterized protein n=1 Tax=Lentinus tigrinus ALCF2SS1-6 TaxID=1328759 RepID=A0A5C2S8D1_9APHY|nr:hypothetical protein L227DRAFT_563692 [Lentinus tigrinus ALCF2SS1-6]RPD74753.1 hypothetical protein L226DRAFT_523080 [Lentinus tigrinus ALCF2SS1-7]